MFQNTNHTSLIVIAGGLFLLAALSSCFKEEFDTSSDIELTFSTDTLRFDTVFTELGSATRAFRVYNPADLAVKVQKISLESVDSRYRLNVDGVSGAEVFDTEIRGKDSIWVFVQVTINPDDPVSVSPFITEDYVVFETNGNIQKVLLEAWGQNANYIPSRFHGNQVSLLTCDLQMERWDDPKPYVIYGTLIIDSCTLVLPKGTQVYVHGGIADNDLGVYNDGLIYTLRRGRIVTEGTLEEPVIIQDDRLEPDYVALWGGIQFGPASGPHRFSHTTIRYAVNAIVADSATRVDLDNCVIHSTAGAGIFARHAQINAVNCLFYDNGGNSVALTFGGRHRFDYCTIASYGNDSEGLGMNNFYCVEPLCQGLILVNPMDAIFRNSIIVGSSSDELLLSDAAEGQGVFDVQLDHCIVQVDDLLDPDAYPDFFTTICSDCIEYGFGDTLFVKEDDFDFHLDTTSIAERQALPIPSILTDLDGVVRDPGMPDIGCYEFQ